ncbi:hypothetical protein CRM22_002212 [Opisthorchis felineus]|uniref:Uncharacterized protein n=1 Tax=Opisthorchis felineus TaxID=147828 RepID=A0A4S2M758_OPIFE|nr:hypothetical protein CRM22_002212 [Opisthorchis felineus]
MMMMMMMMVTVNTSETILHFRHPNVYADSVIHFMCDYLKCVHVTSETTEKEGSGFRSSCDQGITHVLQRYYKPSKLVRYVVPESCSNEKDFATRQTA